MAHLTIAAAGIVRCAIGLSKSGHPLDDFLHDFPAVSREQAVAALELAKDALLRAAAA